MSEVLSEIKKMAADLSKNASDRIKLPIVTIYLLTLFAYNWDLLFILFFSNNDAILKVNYVKSANFGTIWLRPLIPLLLSIFFTPLFPWLQIKLNQFIQNARKDERKRLHDDAKENAKNAKDLSEIRSGALEKQQLQNIIDDHLNTIKNQANEIEEKNKIIALQIDEIKTIKDSLEKTTQSLQGFKDEEEIKGVSITSGIKKLKIYYYSLDPIDKTHLRNIISGISHNDDIVDFTEELIYGDLVLNEPMFAELVKMNLLKQAIDNKKRKVFEVTEHGRHVFNNLKETGFF